MFAIFLSLSRPIVLLRNQLNNFDFKVEEMAFYGIEVNALSIYSTFPCPNTVSQAVITTVA